LFSLRKLRRPRKLKEATMNKNFSTALGLTLAIALTTGGVLVKHPPATGDKAPGAYSDITIVQDDSKRVVPPQVGDKQAVPD